MNWLRTCLGLSLLFGLFTTVVAAEEPGNYDPFSRENVFPPILKPKNNSSTKAYIDFRIAVTPGEVRRGEVTKLVIVGVPKGGWHTYPLTQRSADPGQTDGELSKIEFADSPGLRPLYPIRETDPQWARNAEGDPVLEHDKLFTWIQEIMVLPDAAVGPHTLNFKIVLQVCEESCLRGTQEYEVSLKVSDEPAVPLTPEMKARLEEKPPALKVVPVPAGLPKSNPQSAETTLPSGPTRPSVGPSNTADMGLFALLLASMGAAVAMLFTPCVFPMIPITVSFFLKRSEKKHNSLATAAVYSLTIIVVLSLAVLLLGGVIVQLANSWYLNLGLGAILIFFALSLFGMYEIELPNALARFTSARESKGGYSGAVFMALTFTITSFTCTGPFLGPLLVAAKEAHFGLDRLILASVAYSTTFAAPFFVMALFPGLLKKLPRSGGWLNSVKVVMGFLELGAALKFLANTDIVLNPGNPRLFTFDTVVVAWIVLSAACALYLLGFYRLPHDSPLESVGVPRLILATICFGMAIYLLPALFGRQPQGVVGEWVIGFAPLNTAEQSGGTGTSSDGKLDWYLDYDKAWEQAVREKKPIFIDFTGVNCTNCRANENKVFPQKDVRQELEKCVRVRLYTDSVPDRTLSAAEAKERADRNLTLESKTFKDETTPLYALIRPDANKAYDGDRLAGTSINADRPIYKGFIHDPVDFTNWLRIAREKQVAQGK